MRKDPIPNRDPVSALMERVPHPPVTLQLPHFLPRASTRSARTCIGNWKPEPEAQFSCRSKTPSIVDSFPATLPPIRPRASVITNSFAYWPLAFENVIIVLEIVARWRAIRSSSNTFACYFSYVHVRAGVHGRVFHSVPQSSLAIDFFLFLKFRQLPFV